MLACALFYTAETSIIRWIGPGWPAPVTLFWREIAAICILLPFVLHQRGKPLRTQQFKWLVFRSATGTLAMMFSIYAIARLPLATATTLSFTRPMWISLIAFVVLKEPMGWRKLAALALSISGVLWMLQPSAEMPDLEAAIADIGAAFLFAASLVSIRYMTATESPLTIMIYGQLLGLLFTAPLAIWYWRSPDLQQAYILLSVGAVGVCTMACHVKALQAADASVVGPYEYLRLPFAMVAGIALLGEVPGWFTLVGAGLIVSGALIAAMATRTRSPKFKAEPPIEFQLPENHRFSARDIGSIFKDVLCEQIEEAVAHMGDTFWTDGRTGHNIGRNELDAVRMMEGIQSGPTAEKCVDPDTYARWLLKELDSVAERFRLTVPDPDGYGIATIGTVKRNLCRKLLAADE